MASPTTDTVEILASRLGFEELDTRTRAVLGAFARQSDSEKSTEELRVDYLAFEEDYFDLDLLGKCELPREIVGLEPFMTRAPHTVHADDSIADVAQTLLERMITGLPVVDDDSRPIGVVSNTDLAGVISRPELYSRIAELKVRDIMTPRVHKVTSDDSLQRAVQILLSFRLHRVLVVDPQDGKLIGLLTALDCTKILDLLVKRLDLKAEVGLNPYSSSDSCVLIVDDEPSNIRLLREVLKTRCGKLLAATNGLQALERASLTPKPDLILLDISMPEMDGYEVLQRLKSKPETSGIPVIFVTALNDTGSELKGLSLGAVDYITKPFNPALIRSRVGNHLELQRYRSELEAQIEKV